MSSSAASEDSETPQPNRIQVAFDLVMAEAVETLQRRGPRAFLRAQTLLKIAEQLQRESGDRIVHLEYHTDPNIEALRQRQADLTWRATDFSEVEAEDNISLTGTCVALKGPRADLQREEGLAKIELLEATRRREEAQARASLVEELDRLQTLVEKDENSVLQKRIDEILRTFDPTIEKEDHE